MASFRLAPIALVVLVCACALHMSEAKGEWKNIPGMKQFLDSRPVMKAMTEGPLDDLIDLLINALIFIINLIIGQPLMEQINGLTSRVSALER